MREDPVELLEIVLRYVVLFHHPPNARGFHHLFAVRRRRRMIRVVVELWARRERHRALQGRPPLEWKHLLIDECFEDKT